MTSQDDPAGDAAELRRRAEEEARAAEAKTPNALSPKQVRQTLHELRVHQIELEMQNEELRRTQAELETARARYFDLYDLAPVGYVVLSEQGLLLEANFTVAGLLGRGRSALARQPITRFIHREDEAIYYRHRKLLFGTGAPQVCELRMVKADGAAFWVHLEASAAQDAEGAPVCRIVINDITERKRVEKSLLEKEQQYHTLADSGRALIWTSTADKKCDYFNQPWLVFTGRTLEQELGDGWVEGVHPEDLESCIEIYTRAFDRREPFSMNYRLRRHDGEFCWIRDDGTPRYDSQGSFLGYIGHCLDISEQKRAEQALQDSEEKFRSVVEQSSDLISLTDADGVILYVSPASERLFGAKPKEMTGHHFTEFLEQSSIPTAMTVFQEAAEIGWRITGLELLMKRKDGSVFTGELNGSRCQVVPKAVTLVAVRDITARKVAEEALRASEEEYRTILQTAMDGFWLADAQGRLLQVNDAYCRMSGYSADELLVMRIADLEIVEKQSDIATHIQGIMAQGGDLFESRHRRKDRSVFDVEVRVQYKPGGNGQFVAFLHDITERKRAEAKLRESEERLRRAVLQAPFPILLHAADGEVLMISDAWTEITGYSQADIPTIGAWTQRAYGERKDLVQKDINRLYELTEKVSEGEYEIQTKSGKRRTWEFMSAPMGALPDGRRLVMTMAMDVTERKLLEASLAQSQKVESIGRLAGGVAHDFNNLLNVIMGYSGLALRGLKRDHPATKSLAEVQKAAEKAAELTRQLLAFSRKQALHPRVLDLNSVIGESEMLLRRLIREDIHLAVVLGSGLGFVKADPAQINQILMNLVVNSRDSMPEGGELIIETANVELDEAFVRLNLGAQQGSYVMLAVTDTGLGMDQETQDRIFEPFFTTKEVGKGTGLGLSMVYGIVKQSDGYITVHSEPGHGAEFKIYLPRVFETPEAVLAGEAEPLLRGDETILVAEDEPALRELVREFLAGAGYQVLVARDVKEAIEIAMQHEGSLDLLLTDVVMPELSGPQLAEHLQPFRPQMKVLYMSGYADGLVASSRGGSGADLINKPFSEENLLRRLREVLEGRIL